MNLPQMPKKLTIGVQRFKSYVFIKAYRNSISLCLHCTVLKNQILLSASSFQDPMKESSEINQKVNVCIALTIHSPVWIHNSLTVTTLKKREIQNSMTRLNRDLGTAAKTDWRGIEKERGHGPFA